MANEPRELPASWEIGVQNDPGISDMAVARVRRMVRESLDKLRPAKTYVVDGHDYRISYANPRIHQEIDERPEHYTFECRAGDFRWVVRVVSRELKDGEGICMECSEIVAEDDINPCAHCGIDGLCSRCYGLWDGLCLDCAPVDDDGDTRVD